nr:MAG TPA: hypothetical protein [Caudoviricetes sp.]
MLHLLYTHYIFDLSFYNQDYYVFLYYYTNFL